MSKTKTIELLIKIWHWIKGLKDLARQQKKDKAKTPAIALLLATGMLLNATLEAEPLETKFPNIETLREGFFPNEVEDLEECLKAERKKSTHVLKEN